VVSEPVQATYHYGEVVTLTAEAEDGWTFTGWGGDLSGDASLETITMDEGKSVTATFSQDAPLPAVKLTITPDPGDVTVSQAIAYTAMAEDVQGYTWDVTSETAFSIEAGAGGSWTGNVYSSGKVGDWTVTGEYKELTDTASLTVNLAKIFLPVVLRNH